MLRCRANLGIVLIALFLAGSEQAFTYAQHCCRQVRKKACSPCTPQSQDHNQEGSRDSNGPCKCIDTVFYGFPGYYLHYARRYPDCSDCTNFASVIHQATTILSSTNCNDQNCMPSTYRVVASCLPEAVGPDYDIDLRIMAPDYEARGYLMGWVKLPDATRIVARVLLIKLKLGTPGRQFTETFAFGFEAKELPSGTEDELLGMSVASYEGSSCLFQGKVMGDVPCYILTTSHSP